MNNGEREGEKECPGKRGRKKRRLTIALFSS